MPQLPSLPLLDHLPADAPVRTRVLAAGVDLLHEEGFNSLTQQAIAERAGVRQSHITYYFPSRVDLLRNVAQYGCKEMFESVLDNGAHGRVSAKEMREFLLPTKLDRGWLRLMTGMHVLSEDDASVREWLDVFDEKIVTQFHAMFCAVFGEVPLRTVQMLHACFVGVMMFESREQSDASLAQARRTMSHALDVAISTAMPHAKKKAKV